MIKEIETNEATVPWHAARDAFARSQRAEVEHAEFFASADHESRVNATVKIVSDFLRVRKGLYVTRRANGGRPFTTVKIDNPVFPNTKTQAQRDAEFYAPLAELEVEIRFSKGTNSWLFRVR